MNAGLRNAVYRFQERLEGDCGPEARGGAHEKSPRIHVLYNRDFLHVKGYFCGKPKGGKG